ncbi:MAG: hypothetical protein FJ102_11055 [Deltaproteobacteria bacterium]|nr:hypothetical protein [Deltaproteobacteria bacterium]
MLPILATYTLETGACGDFVTGAARWNGELVIGSFDQGACVYRGGEWVDIPLPSEMVNDVAVVGSTLWVATAEGLVAVSPDLSTVVYGEVGDDAPRASPGLNHPGANALAVLGSDLWVADVLGPVRVSDQGWRRYRWHVTGHSYQAVAACAASTWVGSEDDGLAVRGVALGSRNGKGDWHHVNALDGLPEDWVMALACAGPQAAWVGTYRHGVGRVDASGYAPVAGLEDAWVQALAVDGDTLWVGTADGLYRVTDRAEKLTSDDTWTVVVAGEELLVGTREGLMVYPR